VIQLATAWGLPVSTTQVVSGTVMGAGATRRFSAVRWGVARRIVWAWIFTIPASAILAALAALLVQAGPIAVALAVLLLGTIALVPLVRRMRRKQPATDSGRGPVQDPTPADERVNLERGSARGSEIKVGKSR
jgi:Phosphate transporter family